MLSQRLVSTQFLVGLLLMQWSLASEVSGVSANEPSDDELAVLVIDKSYETHAGLMAEIDRYKEQVRDKFQTELISYMVDIDAAPEKLRRGLAQLYSKKKISGASLIGRFQFPIFKNACGDVSTLFAYYSDLDGDFQDTDKDGFFDFYNPWPNAKNLARPHEIWLSVLSPYYHDAQHFRGPDEIQQYFAKVNASIASQAKRQEHKAAILTSKDWPNMDALKAALQPHFGSEVFQRGGYASDGTPISTNADDLKAVLSQSTDICFLYIHSGSSQHVLDAPEFPKNCVLPGELDQPGRVLLEDLPINCRILSIWGCHALDIAQVHYLNGRFLADSYLFAEHSKAQTILGASRSIGLEDVQFLISNRETALHHAWYEYLNHCYSEPFLHQWLGVRGAWAAEKNGFDWGYVIYGNPFDTIGGGQDK